MNLKPKMQTIITETLLVTSSSISLHRMERSAHPIEFHLRQKNDLGFFTVIYETESEATRAWNNLQARASAFPMKHGNGRMDRLI